MNELKLAVAENRTTFNPGEAITGAAGWKLDKAATSIELNLFWRTEGKGSDEADIVASQTFENPQSEEARPFDLKAPDGPYSFSGKLISLIWSLEMVVHPGSDACRIDLIIAPDGKEIELAHDQGKK